MEEKNKLYSRKAIIIATFFFGPFLTGFLMCLNFRKLEKKRLGTIILIICYIYSILLHIVVFSIPDEIFEKIHATFIPFINATLAYFLINKYQGFDLEEYMKMNKPFVSAWKVLAICTICLLIYLCILFIGLLIYAKI